MRVAQTCRIGSMVTISLPLSVSLSLCSTHRALACPTHLPWDLVDDGKGLSPAPRHPPTDISSWVHSTFAYVRLSGCNRVLREAVSLCRIRKKFSRGDPLSTKWRKKFIRLPLKANSSRRTIYLDMARCRIFLNSSLCRKLSKRANRYICWIEFNTNNRDTTVSLFLSSRGKSSSEKDKEAASVS